MRSLDWLRTSHLEAVPVASLRSRILNTAIRYGGKRRLAGLEFTPASIAASRARMERLGDRNASCRRNSPASRILLGGVTTEWTRVPRPHPRRHLLLPRRRLRARVAEGLSRAGRAPRRR